MERVDNTHPQKTWKHFVYPLDVVMLPKICFSAFIWKSREKFTLEMKWRGTSLAVFWEEPIKRRILQWSQVPALTQGLESPFFQENMLLPRRFCLFYLSLGIRHGRSGNLWRVSSPTSMRCLGISHLHTLRRSVWGIARFLLLISETLETVARG